MRRRADTPEEKVLRRERANRLKSMRKMTRCSRRVFTERYSIPPGTLQNWEDARYGGLTEKGAERAIHALASEGVYCSYEWLMFGFGSPPRFSDRLFMKAKKPLEEEEEPKSAPATDDAVHIREELLLFYRHYPNAIDSTIEDDGMWPRLQATDRVAGNRHEQEGLTDLVGLDCIVQTRDGEKLVRQVREGSLPGCYTLACINPNTSVKKPILYDVELVFAAPIIWIRRG